MRSGMFSSGASYLSELEDAGLVAVSSGEVPDPASWSKKAAGCEGLKVTYVLIPSGIFVWGLRTARCMP